MYFFFQGAISCDVYSRKCLANSCTLEYTGEDKSIFFLSKMTCAGDELGWDFVSMVKTTRTSFTAFCNEMTRRYKTTNILSAPFMGVNTFVKWIFAWMAAMKIDFRKEVDPWCNYNPKMLACDGNHVGVSIKHLKLEDAVTVSDGNMEAVQPAHKRYYA